MVLALLSGVLSKVGVYGFLRIVLPIMPEGSQHWQELFIVVAVFSILYGSVLAFSQDNVRLVVAYSSIAQLGFIVLGIFALDDKGAQGAVLQMLNHGLVVVPLFLIIGVIAARAGGSESLAELGGMAFRAPVLAALFLIVTFATLAMPGLGQLRRRDPGPVRDLRGQARLRPGGQRGRGARGRLHDPRLPAHDAQPRRARRSSRVRSTRLDLAAIAPLVAVIVALGVYPHFVRATAREEATTAAIAAGATAPAPAGGRGDRRCPLADVQAPDDRLQGAVAADGARSAARSSC